MTPTELRKETVALAQWFEERGVSARDSIIVMAALIPASLQSTSSKSLKDGGQAVTKLIMDNIEAATHEKH